ncbi:hypothetical protein AYO47_06080 [Planctomyces sp. SCGC AG-212-M04]|nr:hypothetical protein AYO47_06080 [Planctomyces sp. SCGC AG-212-M04]
MMRAVRIRGASAWARSVAIVFAALVTIGANALVSAAAPTLTNVFPPGGQRGTTVTVTCKGKFDWPVSIAAAGVKVTAKEESGKLDVEIPADLAADRVWIRLYNAEGASSAVPFLVGSLKELNEEEPNNSPTKPQKLEGAATINGVLTKGDVDGFAVTLEAGQTLVAAMDANTKLGSPIDAILQVATDKGFVVAENNDEVGLDPRLIYRAEKPGVYIVRAFAFPSTPDSTIAYSGGETSLYRLTITSGPFIAFAAPFSAPLAEPGAVGVLGWNLPEGMKLPVLPYGGADPQGQVEVEPQAEDRLAAESRLGIVFSPEAGSARVRLTPFPVLSNTEPSADQSLALPVPGAVMGRLREPRETDRYRLTLKKGDSLLVVPEGKSDFPADPVLQLADPAGKVVVSLEELSGGRRRGGAGAQVLSHSAAQDGDYELRVRDRFRRGSEWAYYQLTARIEVPDFELTTGADAVVAAPDKPGEVTVNVERRGSGIGTITIEAVDLPEGVTAAAVVSEPKGDSAKKVKLSITTSGGAFSGVIRVKGTAKEPSEINRFARTPVQLGGCFDRMWLTVIAKP